VLGVGAGCIWTTSGNIYLLDPKSYEYAKSMQIIYQPSCSCPIYFDPEPMRERGVRKRKARGRAGADAQAAHLSWRGKGSKTGTA